MLAQELDGVAGALLMSSPQLDKNYKHTIEIVVDRLVNNEDSRGSLVQSVEQALEAADGPCSSFECRDQ